MLDRVLFLYMIFCFVLIAFALRLAKSNRKAMLWAKVIHILATWMGVAALVFVEDDHFLVIRGLVLLHAQVIFLYFPRTTDSDSVSNA